MTLLGDEFVIDGQVIDPDVTQRVVGARLRGFRRLACSIELTIWDGDGKLMREGKLATARAPKKTEFKEAAWARFGAMRLTFDGVLFRLAGVRKRGVNVVLTFDDEAAALMRRHERAIVTSRGSKTRAQTIGLAVNAVKEIAIPYRSPEERIKQNIAEVEEDEAEAKGLSTSDGLTVKGVKATREQLKNMETVLTVCDRLRAGERATLAALVACIQEPIPPFTNDTDGDADSEGILQVRRSTAINITPRTVIDPRTGQTHGAVQRDDTGPIAPGTLDPRDIKGVIRVFLLRGFWGKGGAIQIAAKNPDMEVGEIAQQCQGSAYPDRYQQWAVEAGAILDAWGGVGQTTVLRERFQFQIGGKLDPDDEKAENYWAGSVRLGNELDGWALWAWRNQVNFVSDEWLFKRRAVFTIGPESIYPALRPAQSLAPFVELDYEEDVGAAISEVTITGASRRWDGAPGSVVKLVDLGAVSGKWLVDELDFDLQRDVCTYTLVRPVSKEPEPAPSTTSRTTTETARQESGSPRARIVTAARRALKERARYVYVQARPMHNSLFEGSLPGNVSGPVQPMGIDCSEFVTLVYKAAEVPDPNGANYNGSGNTATLRANGTKTSDPQPGDLAHYGSGAAGNASHVVVYVGNGKAIGIGGAAGVHEHDVMYRSDFAGYYKYDLGSS